jgi:hypothetical protein
LAGQRLRRRSSTGSIIRRRRRPHHRPTRRCRESNHAEQKRRARESEGGRGALIIVTFCPRLALRQIRITSLDRSRASRPLTSVGRPSIIADHYSPRTTLAKLHAMPFACTGRTLRLSTCSTDCLRPPLLLFLSCLRPPLLYGSPHSIDLYRYLLLLAWAGRAPACLVSITSPGLPFPFQIPSCSNL